MQRKQVIQNLQVEYVVNLYQKHIDFFSIPFSKKYESQFITLLLQDEKFEQLNQDFSNTFHDALIRNILTMEGWKAPGQIYKFLNREGVEEFNHLWIQLTLVYENAVLAAPKDDGTQLRKFFQDYPSILEFVFQKKKLLENYAVDWHKTVVKPENELYLKNMLTRFSDSTGLYACYFSTKDEKDFFQKIITAKLKSVDTLLPAGVYANTLVNVIKRVQLELITTNKCSNNSSLFPAVSPSQMDKAFSEGIQPLSVYPKLTKG